MSKDCMNTRTFLEERMRMCAYHSTCSNKVECRTDDGILCPMADGENAQCNDMCWEDPLRAIHIVQKWSDDHPAETIAEHFKKILPDMKINNWSDICCKKLDDMIDKFDPFCDYNGIPTESVCKECWNRVYQDSILPF